MQWLKHAFAIEPEGPATPNAEELAIVERVARAVVRRGMTTPALMALECSHPLNFVAGQFLRFIGPVATLVLKPDDYRAFCGFLERRGSIETLCRHIEDAAAEANTPRGEGDA